MEKNNDNQKNKRPYRMFNVAFPPAKYGLYVAVVIIVICMYLIFFD
jgi:hypothetical protein|tara:strand:- start:96 stop:233 length:138 start_codon:yes stop_codon:yes gene_type:complete